MTSVLLNANTNGAGDHGVTTDMDISVPRGAAIDIASKRGDVTVNDRKADVKITLQHGDVALSEIGGPVDGQPGERLRAGHADHRRRGFERTESTAQP